MYFFFKSNVVIGNPDMSLKPRMLSKLFHALPNSHKLVLTALLNLFRYILHYRHKNNLTTVELCNEFGPILTGSDKSDPTAVAGASAALKTLLIQLPFFLGVRQSKSQTEQSNYLIF